MTPEPGDKVRVTFTGTTGKVYRAGGHPAGELVDMVAVRLTAGDLIYVPLVAGVDLSPDPEAAGT